LKSLKNIHAPAAAILITDMVVSFISLLLAYQLRFNFRVPDSEISAFWRIFPVVLGVRLAGFLISGTYRVQLRYTATDDVFRMLATVFSGSLILAVANPFYGMVNGAYFIPFSIIIIEFLVTIFILVSFRLFIKLIFKQITTSGLVSKPIIIYGSGQTGLITKRALETDLENNFKVVAFLDDDASRVNKKLENVKIWPFSQSEKLFALYPKSELIISKRKISAESREAIVEKALAHGIKILNVPSIKQWINGQLNAKQLKNLKIEELLEREPIQLDNERLVAAYGDKVIFVTGAAGSIGSELVMQLLRYKPKKLILVDQAETPMHELDLKLSAVRTETLINLKIADITDRIKMESVFEKHKPQIVFHAAAYKHVPLMEKNPAEALKVNTFGTKILADLSHRHKAERFVFISTDKAVNPTNVMGASKRLGEMYVQAFDGVSDTRFITTRFGNVLGSNGSVIPRFRAQIENGGPVTVTHPEITRYFMTIPEACSLVLEAGSMGAGGEIFIFDMGKPVQIRKMAEKMIRLAGFVPYKEVDIQFTGLRPGEKLYEELLNDGENVQPTHHPKILISKVIEYDKPELDRCLRELDKTLEENDNFEIVKSLKNLVPEYKSANSEFEKLDIKMQSI
jgi:FlaA1/EpsC-like NDP-sugar epimerase